MSNRFEALQPPRWEANKTAWLLSFIDLTSIMVGFFVLLFSTQTIDRQLWTDVSGSFKAAFAPQAGGVMPVIPDGMNNAFVVASGTPSGLGYLDSLLHQHVGVDAVWGALVAKGQTTPQAVEMYYDVPAAALPPAAPAAEAAWQRLAAVVRSWKNPVIVRAVVPAQVSVVARNAAAWQAVQAAQRLGGAGGGDVRAEVRTGPVSAFHLVVEARR